MTGHAFFGKMSIETTDAGPDDGSYDITIFGADAQKTYGGTIFTFGIETGAIFSWDSDVQYFSASSGSGGGTVKVRVDVNSFMMDYFFGAFIGFEPAKWFRLTVGTGPLLICGTRSTEPEESAPEEFTADSVIEFGAGVYARACADIFFTESFGLNTGVRKNETTLSFNDPSGDIEIDGWQYYIGLAFRF